MTQPRDCVAHLISERAFEALSLEKKATEKLRTIDDTSFADVVICRVTTDAIQTIHGRAREAYAIPFSIMQASSPRKAAMMSIRDRTKDVLKGYTSFYIFNASVASSAPRNCSLICDDDTMFAFYHKESAAIVLVTAIGAAARDKAIRFILRASIETSAGKICCECGAREPKLKKCPCKKVRYCSMVCQLAHWPDHRVGCDCAKSQ